MQRVAHPGRAAPARRGSPLSGAETQTRGHLLGQSAGSSSGQSPRTLPREGRAWEAGESDVRQRRGLSGAAGQRGMCQARRSTGCPPPGPAWPGEELSLCGAGEQAQTGSRAGPGSQEGEAMGGGGLQKGHLAHWPGVQGLSGQCSWTWNEEGSAVRCHCPGQAPGHGAAFPQFHSSAWEASVQGSAAWTWGLCALGGRRLRLPGSWVPT